MTYTYTNITMENIQHPSRAERTNGPGDVWNNIGNYMKSTFSDNRWLKPGLLWTAGCRSRIEKLTITWGETNFTADGKILEWRATAMQTGPWLTHMDSTRLPLTGQGGGPALIMQVALSHDVSTNEFPLFACPEQMQQFFSAKGGNVIFLRIWRPPKVEQIECEKLIETAACNFCVNKKRNNFYYRTSFARQSKLSHHPINFYQFFGRLIWPCHSWLRSSNPFRWLLRG